MIGKPVDYDKKFKENFPIFPPKFDIELKRYLPLINGKEVLDLGIGQGRNSIPLSNLGFNVTGVDYSNRCLNMCKEKCSKLNLIQSDFRNFKIEKDKYDLILSRFALQFLHKDDSYEIMNSMKDNLKKDGLVYIFLFSTEDPKYVTYSNSDSFEVLDNNVFHNKIADTYISFFTKEEILGIFRDFETVFVSEEYFFEIVANVPHYSGVVKYIGKKI